MRAKRFSLLGCVSLGPTYDACDDARQPRANGGKGTTMGKRTLEEDVEASLENIADEGGTVAEHAALLARDHNLSFNEAVGILNNALKQEAEEDY